METIKKHNKENKKLLINKDWVIKTYKLTEAVNNYLTSKFPKPEGREILEKKLYRKDTINSIKIDKFPSHQKEIIQKVEQEENTKELKKQNLINSTLKSSEFKFTASLKIGKKVPTVQYGSVDIEEFRTVRADTFEELSENYRKAKEDAFKELEASETKLKKD